MLKAFALFASELQNRNIDPGTVTLCMKTDCLTASQIAYTIDRESSQWTMGHRTPLGIFKGQLSGIHFEIEGRD